MTSELNEEKVRSNWLKIFKIHVIMILFSYIPYVALPFGVATRYLFFCLLAIVGGFQYLCYHCAYKKKGTKLLGFILVLSTLAFIMMGVGYFWAAIVAVVGLIISLISGVMPLSFYMAKLWAVPLVVTFTASIVFLIRTASFIVSVLLYVMNWKLYRVNKMNQKRLRGEDPTEMNPVQ